MAQSLSDQVSTLWTSASGRWNDQNSRYFYQDYILRLQESAQQADSLSRSLAEELRSLQAELAAVEAVLYT